MKRDMELVRKVLLAIEDKKNPQEWLEPNIDGYTSKEVSYHFMILHQAGLITAKDRAVIGPFFWWAENLTWEGHEFLEAAKNETAWNKTMKVLKEKSSGMSFEVFKQLLIQFVKDQVF